ncbi:MAG TPA: SGNH/GDSL hydrolase family protein [Niallia sp.]|nr:SGNH/GDSL hydrolase family protein [Niallia sp.]
MKNLVCGAIVTVSAGVIIAGNIHWNQKISAQAEQIVQRDTSVIVEQPVEIEPEPTKEKTPQQTEQEKKEQELAAYTQNLPPELQRKITEASMNGKSLNLVIYGSESSSTEKGAWPDLLNQHLIKTYGEKFFNLNILSEGDKTTVEVIRTNSFEKVNDLKPDIIIFEPFMISDNSRKISMKNRIGYIQKIMDTWKKKNEQVTILLQPSNPIYSATYFPIQVEEIKNFAKKNNITYIDHWENWPDEKNKKLKQYLTTSNLPNKSGHKTWAEYLSQYFGTEGQVH